MSVRTAASCSVSSVMVKASGPRAMASAEGPLGWVQTEAHPTSSKLTKKKKLSAFYQRETSLYQNLLASFYRHLGQSVESLS